MIDYCRVGIIECDWMKMEHTKDDHGVEQTITALMNDVDELQAAPLELKRLIRTRIELAARSLVGRERAPDVGPWTVAPNGYRLCSDDFEHDVNLIISGDFFTDQDRIAYANQLASQLNSSAQQRR